MPAEADKLPDQAIEQIRAWIASRRGLRQPAGRHGRELTDKTVSPSRSRVLVVSAAGASQAAADRADASWCRTPVDSSCWPGSKPPGLKPNGPADRRKLDSPGLFRPDRPAADARGSRGVSGRHGRRRLRAADRPPAGQPALRRALGPALARPGPVRREPRLRAGLRPADGLPLPRFRDPGLQRGHAVRQFVRLADRRRRVRARQQPGPDGHRLSGRGHARHADHGQPGRRRSATTSWTTWPPRSARRCWG